MATDWYAPNQQAVRPDEDGPATETNGEPPVKDEGPVERSIAAAGPPPSPAPQPQIKVNK